MRICGLREVDGAQRDRAWLIDVIALGLFVLLTGVLLIVPGRQWAEWSAGVGAILLGKNLVHHVSGLRVRRAGVAVGSGAIAAGLGGLAWPDSPLLGIFLVATAVVALALALLEYTTRR